MASGKVNIIEHPLQLWTPHIYDYETYKTALPQQKYIKVNNLVIAFIEVDSFPSITFSTMIQIRNVPCDAIISGVVYLANVNGQGGTWTIQGSGHNAYLRPNYKGNISGGVFDCIIIGYNY